MHFGLGECFRFNRDEYRSRPPGLSTVLTGELPAARSTDMAVCVGPPDVIALGSTAVMIGGSPAARVGDLTAHGGGIAALQADAACLAINNTSLHAGEPITLIVSGATQSSLGSQTGNLPATLPH